MGGMKLKIKDLDLSMTTGLCEIITKLYDFFHDYEKCAFWLTTPNPSFGHIAPIKLMAMGKTHRVLEFIRNAREENGTTLEPKSSVPREWFMNVTWYGEHSILRAPDTKPEEAKINDDDEVILVREVLS